MEDREGAGRPTLIPVLASMVQGREVRS